MLRKDYKQIQDQSVKFLAQTTEKASKAGLHWVLFLWESPFKKQVVNKRVGYFEDVGEADFMKDYLANNYARYPGVKFYIITSHGNIKDGGLFDA